MKKINILFGLILSMLLLSSCREELPSLDSLPDESTVKFRVEQDKVADPGGNTVILISETPQAVPIWDYGTGRSNRVIDTIRFAFKGEYTIKYSALTGGGVVDKDPIIIVVTADNLSYVDDPLWTALSGGVGKEKTWYLDLNADGVSKYWKSPLYFSGNGLGWQGRCDVEKADLCWIWEADWPGNTWIGDAGDYGSMTFSLKGGPFVTVEHKLTTSRGTEHGTYYLDVASKTLTMTDAAPLQNGFAANDIGGWNNFKLISLTEDAMQIGAFHGTKEELIVFNYISKAYSDKWVPVDAGEPEINLDLGGNSTTDVIAVSKTKTWSLSPNSPFDWAALDGTILNGWKKASDYADWAGYNASFASEVSKNKMLFSADGNVKLTYADGSETEGKFTVDEASNTIKFQGVTPNFSMGSWAKATTTDKNEWKVVKVGFTGSLITDIWFGKRDAVKPEYMVFHFVLGSSAVDPLEAARKEITAALVGPTGQRKFKVSDSWHVDWLGADLTGGWTSATSFGTDFTSNSWVWTEAVKQGIQEPRLTFYTQNGQLFCKKDQDGQTTMAQVTIDAENNAITIDMNLIAFKDAASWLPTYGPKWYFAKNPINQIATSGMWLAVPSPGKESEEKTAIHYVVADE